MELKVKEVIKSKGLTMQQVADILGVTRDTLTRNINGNPTVETLEKIAKAIGVEITDLFEKSSEDVVGAIRIGDNTHVINSKDDIKKLAENL